MQEEKKFSVQDLASAIKGCPGPDALQCQFTPQQWDILAAYLQPREVEAGHILIERGAPDRAVYLVESGALSVHYEDSQGRVRMAIVGAGSVVGEGGFFSHLPRAATVQSSGPARLWFLSPMRFVELANRHSPVALDLTLGLAAVMAKRIYNPARRVAVS
ncbi:MAG: cyclic nucleotide-binding domain-containing protein [Polaromonas sp.]|nr:cyclic nucleotide-binding domain-containing protein [Polaromonas sp.]